MDEKSAYPPAYAETPSAPQPMPGAYPPPMPGMIHQPHPYSNYPQQQPMTTVVVQQPSSVVIHGSKDASRDWSTGLCGCCEDVGSCLVVCLCYECYSCYVSSQLGEHFCMPCCVPYAAAALRLKLRTQHNIRGSIFKDCCANTFCAPCTLCQLKREHDFITRQ